jgi:hypothetical protein
VLVQLKKRSRAASTGKPAGALTLGLAKEIAGTLSLTSKLGCYSTSISASKCNIGQHLAKQSRAGLLGELKATCHDCYATSGNYHYPSVKLAMKRRFDGLTHPQWVDAMVRQIAHYSPHKFRWFDSGDLQSVRHLERIAEVARRLPDTPFWLPTREVTIVRDYLGRHGSFPENLCVRISGSFIDRPPQVFAGLESLPTSSVHSVKGEHYKAKGHIECKAYTRGKCGPCTACFDKRVSVSYPLH